MASIHRSRPYRPAVRTAMVAMLAAVGLFLGIPRAAVADDAPRARATALVQSANKALYEFFADLKWVALRNLMGSARAIYIAPNDKGAGFLIAGGDGVLLCRHGADWSDPVFMRIDQLGVGMLAGVAEQSLIIVIMTDAGVDNLIAGVMRVGGSGQVTFGNWGAGGGGSSGALGGLQVITVSTGKGLFEGSGLSGMKMSPRDAFNQATYGSDVDLSAVISGRGGQMVAAAGLQATLRQAVDQSWGRWTSRRGPSSRQKESRIWYFEQSSFPSCTRSSLMQAAAAIRWQATPQFNSRPIFKIPTRARRPRRREVPRRPATPSDLARQERHAHSKRLQQQDRVESEHQQRRAAGEHHGERPDRQVAHGAPPAGEGDQAHHRDG
jgi:lipid-binding SYLF domain-containing protein